MLTKQEKEQLRGTIFRHLDDIATSTTAYDATHGYSDQYILEVDVFNTIAKEAGLQPDNNYFTKFPNNNLATVSVNLLKGN